ncbi:MAG TPA: lysylphosphatidylglycerol synthase transmembrane domain-containing protein [Candidatus Dormibacteraeota bacterium]|nr:lysylphosphatidylglycerol synthase transmembrane domain-containing protein [Candidatus Dormibacteraeota bacterium]
MEETESQSGSLASGEASPASPVKRVLLAMARLGLGLGLLVYLVQSGVINLRAIERLITFWPFAIGAGVLFLGDIVLMALRLSLLFRPHTLKLSLGSAFRLTLVGQFFTAFLPGGAGGDVVKMYYATRENRGRRTEIVTIVLFDRAVGMFSLVLLSLLIAPFFLSIIRSSPVLSGLLIAAALLTLALLVGGGIAIYGFPARHRFVQKLLDWLPGGSHARRVMETLRSYRHNLGALAAAVGLGLAGNLTTLASTMLIGLVMNPGAIAWRMSFLIPLGDVANSIPLTPGGLGVGEAAFGLLFSLGGLARGADILLGWRLVTVLVSLVGLVFYLQGLRRCVSALETVSPRTIESIPE